MNLFELTRGLFGNDLVGRLVPFLGTDQAKTESIVDAAISTLGTGLIGKASGGGLDSVFALLKPFLGGSFDFLKFIAPTNGLVETLTKGHEINQSLFGDGLKGIEQSFSAAAGISDHLGAKALKVIMPSLIGTIGSKLGASASASDLGELLLGQIDNFKAKLPGSIKFPFDLGSLGTGLSVAGLAAAALPKVDIPEVKVPEVEAPTFDSSQRITAGISGAAAAAANAELPKVELPKVEVPKVEVPKVEVPSINAAANLPEVTGRFPWGPLLGLAALGALAFFGWKSCTNASLNLPDVDVTAIKPPKMPEVKVPDIKMPDVNLPDVNLPDVNLPDVNVPDVNLPEVNVPKVEVPAGADVKIELDGGIKLDAAPDGIEYKLVDFIKSNKPVDKTTWFTFDRLYFDTAKSSIKGESKRQLENLAAILKAYPAVKLKIGGYTDNRGSDAYNMKLSTSRAQATVAALVKLGVDKARLSPEGYGEQHPIASNDTEEGRAKNRRIDVRVTAK